MNILEFEQEKERILSGLSVMNENVDKVKSLLKQSGICIEEPIVDVIKFYDVSLLGSERIIKNLLDLLEKQTILYSQVKHSFDVERVIRQAKIKDN